MSKKIFVVRHGKTDWNAQKKIQGSVDIELNADGLSQAKETARKLADVHFDVIYCSPLKRARQTAETIGRGRVCKMIFDDRLKERNYGEFEGTIKANFFYNDFWAYGKNLHYEKAENVRDFFDRVYSFLDSIKDDGYSEILIVCHAGVEKAIECYFNGMMDDEVIGDYLPDNGSVLVYEF